MTKAKKPAPTAVAKPYEAMPHEQEALARYQERAKTEAPRVTVEMKGGAAQLGIDHPEVSMGALLVMDAIGARDQDFYNNLISQLANVSSQEREVDARQLNFMLSVVKGIEPRDQLEALLAAQMAAVHNATMTFARRLAHIENIPQQDSASNAFNKLARTFAAQLEALKKYRSTGEQRVTVQHVQVNDGGQAIVGNVTTGGRGILKKQDTTP